jgi:hypothetical protein
MRYSAWITNSNFNQKIGTMKSQIKENNLNFCLRTSLVFLFLLANSQWLLSQSSSDPLVIENDTVKVNVPLEVGTAQVNGRLEAGTARVNGRLEAGTARVNGRLEVNTTEGLPLKFPSALGNKISLWGDWESAYCGFGIGSYSLLIHTDKEASDILFGYRSKSSFTETMRIKGNGNVGIGIEKPEVPLHVNGAIQAKSIKISGIYGPTDRIPLKIDFGGSRKDDYVKRWTTERQIFFDTGKRFNRNFEPPPVDFKEESGNQSKGNILKVVTEVSIYASANISSGGFLLRSDSRTKTIEGVSDGQRDLAVLREIEVTDYRMKDVVQHGSATHKKVIAQQVREVYPQAVFFTVDEIPDIYRPAEISGGWVQIVSDLEVGEKVLLILEDRKQVFEVLETRPDAFRVATDQEGIGFVYGRQVDDFHQVDYDAIAMLNVSATQELAEQVELLQMENQAQTKRIEELEKQLEGLEDLKASLSRVEGMLRKETASTMPAQVQRKE